MSVRRRRIPPTSSLTSSISCAGYGNSGSWTWTATGSGANLHYWPAGVPGMISTRSIDSSYWSRGDAHCPTAFVPRAYAFRALLMIVINFVVAATHTCPAASFAKIVVDTFEQSMRPTCLTAVGAHMNRRMEKGGTQLGSRFSPFSRFSRLVLAVAVAEVKNYCLPQL